MTYEALETFIESENWKGFKEELLKLHQRTLEKMEFCDCYEDFLECKRELKTIRMVCDYPTVLIEQKKGE